MAAGMHWPVPARLDCRRRDHRGASRGRYSRTARRWCRRHPAWLW